jgi:hypothetical protein
MSQVADPIEMAIRDVLKAQRQLGDTLEFLGCKSFEAVNAELGPRLRAWPGGLTLLQGIAVLHLAVDAFDLNHEMVAAVEAISPEFREATADAILSMGSDPEILNNLERGSKPLYPPEETP